MSRAPSLPALLVGAFLLGGCAGPAAPASPDTSATPSAASASPAAPDPTPVPIAGSASESPPAAVDSVGPETDSVPLAAGSVVRTLAGDGLRVRSLPSTDEDSFKREPLLPLGTALLILDGPVSGSGYEWYDVAALTLMEAPDGWVASGSRDGEAWIAPGEFDCPPAPTTMRSLLDLAPGIGLYCFPNEPITVHARLLSCNCDVDGAWYTPQWFSAGGGDMLVEPERLTVPQDYRETIPVSLDPAGSYNADLPMGEVVEVTGVFDHPAASTCTLTQMDGEPMPDPGCRLLFAVTRLASIEGP
jgi:hypothetical protein